MTLPRASTICAVTAAQPKNRTDAQAMPPVTPDQAPPDAGMIPLTVPEIKRLLSGVLTRPAPAGIPHTGSPGIAATKPASRWFHQRARLNREYALVT